MSIDAIVVREIEPSDFEAFYALRLQGLRNHPEAFGEDADAFEKLSPSSVGERLTKFKAGGGFTLGAFGSNAELIGVTGVMRDQGIKRRHLASVWGVYVAPKARGKRVGELLLTEVINRARALPELAQLRLGVSTVNAAAHSLYIRLGFTTYGTEPAAILADGRYYDEYLMVLHL